jgi:hypothetical protein
VENEILVTGSERMPFSSVGKFMPIRSYSAILAASFIVPLLPVLSLQSLKAQEQKEESPSKTSDFIRMTKSEDGQPLSLDTAVVSYVNADRSLTVDLIGAVHIGEGSYYDELNQLFDRYDVLLYELVAPEGTVVNAEAGRNSNNPISMLQNATKNFLGMESQLDRIDYSKKHFVRADMTPDQIAAKMQERGENMLTLALSALTEAMRAQAQSAKEPNSKQSAAAEMNLFQMLQNPQQTKLMMAEQFVGTESLDQALGGSLNQLLVVDRNTEALKVLQKTVDEGVKKIGIFYGAAHLPDFERRLLADFQLTKDSTQWVKAWDLTSTEDETNPTDPFSLMLDLLKEIK